MAAESKSLIDVVQRFGQGRLKIYIGYAPGVGKTYHMLSKGLELLHYGLDVVVGAVEGREYPETRKLLSSLDVIPPLKTEYHGLVIEELNLKAILNRRPEVVLIDDLAHVNVPGSKNTYRYQDIQELKEAGIHVITTLNVYYLESLSELAREVMGIALESHVPDSVVQNAERIVNVDPGIDELQRRLREGKFHTDEDPNPTFARIFQPETLETLRTITHEKVSNVIGARSGETPRRNGTPQKNLVVCLSCDEHNGRLLVTRAAHLAHCLNGEWFALHIQTPKEQFARNSPDLQRMNEHLELATQLGAIVFKVHSENVVESILGFAREHNVEQIVIGRTKARSLMKRWINGKSSVELLLDSPRGHTLVQIDTATSPSEQPA